MRWKGLILAAVLFSSLVALWIACSQDNPAVPVDQPVRVEGDNGADRFDWAIGPIEGITTVWHAAPSTITVPVGTTLRFKAQGALSSTIRWGTALEVSRGDLGSIAECHIASPGQYEVSVSVRETRSRQDRIREYADGDDRAPTFRRTCIVNAIDVAFDRVKVVELEPHVKPFGLGASSSNWETSKTLREGNSISQFRHIGPNHYLTAVNRPVALGATLSDPRFSTIIETRISGERPILGAETILISESGQHTVSVGPPSSARSFVIDTYKVSITSHQIGRDAISDDVPVTFVAKTDPPGHEQDITWISSTKFGIAEPVVGHGPTFTVEFHSTVGLDDPVTPSTWLGVRADNAVLVQDQFIFGEVDTCTAISCPPAMQYCEFEVVWINDHADCAAEGLVLHSVACVGPCPFDVAPGDCPETRWFMYKGCLWRGARNSADCQPPCANRFVLK